MRGQQRLNLLLAILLPVHVRIRVLTVDDDEPIEAMLLMVMLSGAIHGVLVRSVGRSVGFVLVLCRIDGSRLRIQLPMKLIDRNVDRFDKDKNKNPEMDACPVLSCPCACASWCDARAMDGGRNRIRNLKIGKLENSAPPDGINLFILL